MKILVLVNDLDDNKIVKLIHNKFFDYVLKDITVRNQKMVLNVGGEEVAVQFASKNQNCQAYAGLRVDFTLIEE